MKRYREFTEEEVIKLIRGMLNYRPASRWEIFRDWLKRVVIRRNK